MENKLWIFGDSNSAPFDPMFPYAKQYMEYKGYRTKIYGELISEKVGLEHINKAVPGSDNYSIFQSFCDYINDMNKGDVVIIGWSSILRFRLVTDSPTKNWLSILPNWENNLSGFAYVSEQTIDEILLNRDNENYIKEVNSWITLINHTLKIKGIKVCHWSLFFEKLDVLDFVFHLPEYTIYSETKGKIKDMHLAELGHRALSEFILRNTIKALV